MKQLMKNIEDLHYLVKNFKTIFGNWNSKWRSTAVEKEKPHLLNKYIHTSMKTIFADHFQGTNDYVVTKYSLALEYAGVELQSLTNCKLDGNLNYLRDLSIVS
ncbi:hypothetical protein RIR_jg8335.t1 [Rhizophagus irregularis DAOM 181602=DAOM 197198]|nr:hypothetical protein RIR_jg8335.t1 [Rhizophagus irregularis DAOM 181602=DAOM 197198]